MIAIIGGLVAAVLWALANLVSSRSARIIGEDSTLAWMMLVGLIVTTPLAVASGPLPDFTPTALLWLTGSGLGSVVGLAFLYRGLRVGKVGVVAALGSTEGALAAGVSVLRGESLPPLAIAMLAVVAIGIVAVGLASRPSETAPEGIGAAVDEATSPDAGGSAAVDEAHDERQAVAFGVAAALCFGLAIYSTGQAGLLVAPMVAVMPARIAGVVGVLLPLALLGRLRLSRRAIPMVVVIGLGEVFGNAAYILGARESLAISAVLASQYGAVAAVAAFFAFRERLSRTQIAGIVTIAIGVAVLSAVRA
jgi:drug/metabolite transporter (DMT)-like permease